MSFQIRCRRSATAPAHSPIALALVAIGVALGAAAALPAAAGADSAAELDAKLDEIIAAPGGPPGVSVLIHRKGVVEYRRRGVSDVATGRAPIRGERARIASMSKAYNGAVALSLVARGRLGLDDTIGDHLPNLLPRARKVTLRQLLRHTGGLPDYIRDRRFIDQLIADPAAYMPPRRLVSFVREKPLRFRPGSRYEYSDTDNVVVGLIAAKVAGRSYERLLRRNVYRSLKLERTRLPRTVGLASPFMHGYEVLADDPPEDVSSTINPALAWSSGGMISTLPEVGRFFRAYVGGRLFDRGTRRAQHRFVNGSSSPPGPGRNAAGLGLFRYRTACGTVHGHTGSFPGYRLFAAASANGKRSVAFFVNSQIVPGEGSPEVSALIRRAQALAVCRAMRG